MPTAHQTEKRQAEAHWALVHRVLASQQFRRTVRLRDFLRYVATRSIEHPGTPVPEQEIGTAVFGRPAEYDTGADNIVRVSAGDVRRRLEHYFLDEGAGESVTAEMPRGGYTLSFRARIAEEAPPPAALASEPAPAPAPNHSPTQPPPVPADAPPVLPAPAESVRPPGVSPAGQAPLAAPARIRFATWVRDARTAAIAVLCLCLAAALGYTVLQTRREPWQETAPLRSIWTNFLGANSGTEIVLADSSYAIMRSITRTPVALPDYLNYRYREAARDPHLDSSTQAMVGTLLARNTGSISEFEAARAILALTHHPARLLLGSAHDFTPASITSSNVVLLGGSQSNPWVDLYRAQRTLIIEQQPGERVAVVRNLKMQPGEQATYQLEGNSDSVSGYAVVAILPNVDARRRVMIVEGTDSQATLAASNFVTSAAGAAALATQLHSVTGPRQIEILLRSSKLLATALDASIVTVHAR